MPVCNAAREMKQRLHRAASELLKIPAERLISRENFVFDSQNPETKVPFDDVVVHALGTQGGTIVTKGSYTPPAEAQGGKFKGAGVGPPLLIVTVLRLLKCRLIPKPDVVTLNVSLQHMIVVALSIH